MITSLLCEFIGTMFFICVMLFTGSAVWTALALAFSIVFSSMIDPSSGHLNPLVSLVSLLNKKIGPNICLGYVLAQLSAGLVSLIIYKKWSKKA